MHDTVMLFVGQNVAPMDIYGKRVLEVGSYDVNGSPGLLLKHLGPSEYIGVDMREGPGVDQVVDACDLEAHFGANSFDVVISTEMLEHALDWRRAVTQMKRVLKVGGRLILTTRSRGFPQHDYPHDHWRFSLADMANIFSDMWFEALESDSRVPGVFVCALKTQGKVAELSHINAYRMPDEPMG